MKFAIDLPVHSHFADPNLLLDLALEAEASGWDGVFLWDHINWFGKSPRLTDPWITLAAIAAKTERIKIGTMVTPLSRRRPWKLARETVALDHLSKGRLILGVGLGASPKLEFATFGEVEDAVLRAERLDESLQLLQAFWSGEKVSFNGKHYQVEDVAFLPTPLQIPRIPIWVAGYWPNKRPLRRAARWDGVFSLQSGSGFKKMMQPATVADVKDYVELHRSNQEPFEVIHWGISSGNPAEDQPVYEQYEAAGATWWLENFNPSRGSLKQLRSRISRGP